MHKSIWSANPTCSSLHACPALPLGYRPFRNYNSAHAQPPSGRCTSLNAVAVNVPSALSQSRSMPDEPELGARTAAQSLRKPAHSPSEGVLPSKTPKFNDAASSSVDIYNTLPVSTEGADIQPFKSFNAFRFRSNVLRNNLRAQNVQKPTVVQQYVIPAVQCGRDVVVSSPPGTGKTLAFLIPVMQQLMRRTRPTTRNFAYPQAVILCTSWEHCMQVQETCKQLVAGSHLKIVSLHGGIPIVDQSLGLRGGCDIVVATVGRLLDHLDRGRVRLANLQVLVMDNAEQLLTGGSQLDLRRILFSRSMPPATGRQTLAFSSSLSAGHHLVLKELMNDPINIQFGSPVAAPPHLSQQVLQLEQGQKFDQLLQHLKLRKKLAVVFCSTRSRVEDVYSFLQEKDMRCCSIHRDHTQIERENSWQSFKYGVSPVLVTTSIAARGLDIPEVDLVINFDLPRSIQDYLCRIGRTGRAGRPGLAISYFSNNKDGGVAADLVESLALSGHQVPRWLENQVDAFERKQASAAAASGRESTVRGAGVETSGREQLRRIGRNPPEFGAYLPQPSSTSRVSITDAETQSFLEALSKVGTRKASITPLPPLAESASQPSSDRSGVATDAVEAAQVSGTSRSEQILMTLGPGVREGRVSIPREKLHNWQQLARLGGVAWPKMRRSTRGQRQGRNQQQPGYSSRIDTALGQDSG